MLGNNFTVYTDHSALMSAFMSHMGNQTKGLLSQCYLRISRFLPKMRLAYKPKYIVADLLSRAPVENNKSIAVLQVAEVLSLKLIQE